MGSVSVYVSVGEPARQSVHGSACEQTSSGSEFEVGSATSGEDNPQEGLPESSVAGCGWQLGFFLRKNPGSVSSVYL